jgi:hypothetical protein
MEKSLDMEMKP